MKKIITSYASNYFLITSIASNSARPVPVVGRALEKRAITSKAGIKKSYQLCW